MVTNLLGDVRAPKSPTSILSSNELMQREALMLQKSMNFRDSEDHNPVFLVLPSHDGEYRDAWHPETHIYTFEGHDSTTVDAGGKAKDQLMQYASGKLTDNGRFYKEAVAYKDGVRKEPLQIHVYEKLDTGAWFDKGTFDLVDAVYGEVDGRKVFRFNLRPSDVDRTDRDDTHRDERFLAASEKALIWKRDGGRCARCGTDMGLRFVLGESGVSLVCAKDRGEEMSGGLLGW